MKLIHSTADNKPEFVMLVACKQTGAPRTFVWNQLVRSRSMPVISAGRRMFATGPIQDRFLSRRFPSPRCMSSDAFDLDQLMANNKYGGDRDTSSLESLIGKNRYGGDKFGPVAVKDIAPEYPHDLDLGPLFCVKANRCFLDGGKRCGQYQAGNRNKGMLQDLHAACTETGFFFVHSTMIDESDLVKIYDHMSDLDRGHAEWQLSPRAEGDEGRGFFPVGDHAKTGIPARHGGFRMGRPGSRYGGDNAWPEGQEGLRDAMEDYYDKVDHVSDQLLKAFADLFGLETDALQKLRSADSASDLELLHFPGDADAGGSAYSEEYRTAPGAFLIFNNNEPCLQVRGLEGEWCNVRVGTERLVVLIGDAMERLTNGHLPATKFKVTPSRHERQAIKFSARFDPDVTLQPLPEFGDPDAKYPAATQLQLLQAK